MNVAEATQRIEGTVMAGSSAVDREIQGGYASDLLSDVMGNSREGDIWVTHAKARERRGRRPAQQSGRDCSGQR